VGISLEGLAGMLGIEQAKLEEGMLNRLAPERVVE
jgi:hypothetical protein